MYVCMYVCLYVCMYACITYAFPCTFQVAVRADDAQLMDSMCCCVVRTFLFVGDIIDDYMTY